MNTHRYTLDKGFAIFRGYENRFIFFGLFKKERERDAGALHGQTRYTVQLKKSPFKSILFISSKKPVLPLWAWTIIGLIYLTLQWIVFMVALPLFSIWQLLSSFIITCLFNRSFITSTHESFSGYLWFVLGLIGIASIVKFAFFG